MDDEYDVVVVGAGPAGMMAAMAAASGGARTVIVEHLLRPGAKLVATGGGHCNLSNTLDEPAFLASFGRQGRFLQPALAAMGRDAFLALLEQIGVPTHCPDGMRIYPQSDSAADVRQALWNKCVTLGVRPMLGTEVRELTFSVAQPLSAVSSSFPSSDPQQEQQENSKTQPRAAVPHVAGVRTDHGEIAAQAVILATGGKSYPKLGATGVGYELARQAGHEIVPPLPALTALIARETWPGRCAGVSLSDVRVWIDRKGAPKAGVRGEILFTHTGLSGPAILDISGEVSTLLYRSRQTTAEKRGQAPISNSEIGASPLFSQGDLIVRLNLLPEMTAGDWMTRFDQWQHEYGARSVVTLLAEHMPHSLARVLCEMAKIARPAPEEGEGPDLVLPPLACAHMDRSTRQTLADLLTALPLTIRATEGFDKAMVTRGGVKLREVDPHTLQSKLAEGLYFAGEILDLDGPSGGFNLQMAFSTGYLAGLSAGKISASGRPCPDAHP
jgi:predicted flavoprotein YhiN